MDPNRDLRKYASTTQARLIVGALVILAVVGLGLVAWIYGFRAALMGLLCVLGGLIPIALVVLLFYLMGIIVRKNRGE